MSSEQREAGVSGEKRALEKYAIAPSQLAADRYVQFAAVIDAARFGREVMVHAGQIPWAERVFDRYVEIVDAARWCRQELVCPAVECVQRCKRRPKCLARIRAAAQGLK